MAEKLKPIEIKKKIRCPTFLIGAMRYLNRRLQQRTDRHLENGKFMFRSSGLRKKQKYSGIRQVLNKSRGWILNLVIMICRQPIVMKTV